MTVAVAVVVMATTAIQQDVVSGVVVVSHGVIVLVRGPVLQAGVATQGLPRAQKQDGKVGLVTRAAAVGVGGGALQDLQIILPRHEHPELVQATRGDTHVRLQVVEHGRQGALQGRQGGFGFALEHGINRSMNRSLGAAGTGGSITSSTRITATAACGRVIRRVAETAEPFQGWNASAKGSGSQQLQIRQHGVGIVMRVCCFVGWCCFFGRSNQVEEDSGGRSSFLLMLSDAFGGVRNSRCVL